MDYITDSEYAQMATNRNSSAIEANERLLKELVKRVTVLDLDVAALKYFFKTKFPKDYHG